MKVLFAVGRAYPLYGGAQITCHSLARRLAADHGFSCLVTTRHPRRLSGGLRGVPFRSYRDLEDLREIALLARPDVVVATLDATPDALRLAARYGLPTAVYLPSFEYCPPTAEEVAAWGVSAEKAYPDEEERAWVLSEALRLVVNSEFLRARFVARTGAEPDVLYPELVCEDFLVRGDARGRAVAAVCGHRYKGAEIVLSVAESFPCEEFLVVGDVEPRLAPRFARLANVTLAGRRTPTWYLRRSKVVLVPSQWPEPFGRVAVEAMANGLPVLASATGGLGEAVGSSSRLVGAFRDAAAWAERLGELLGRPRAAGELGAEGREYAERFLEGRSSRKLASDLRALAARMRPSFDGLTQVALCGGAPRTTAFSLVNERWAAHTPAFGKVAVECVDPADRLKRMLPEVVVHHNYAEPFSDISTADAGRLVAVRTWDFGPFPPSWVSKINAEYDQLWVYSRWVCRQAVASGVRKEKARVVPLGFDDLVFTPEGPEFRLRTRKSFRFLFVGAPVARKGIDVLLEAYRRAFRREDDVCLVVKANRSDVFYEGQTPPERIEKLTADPHSPEVEYVDEFLPAEGLAALYRACDIGVFPYRAEGFCLPILEAAACGVPSVVPRFGSCLDYCSVSTSLFVRPRRVRLPVFGRLAINSLGFTEEVEEVEFCEVGPEALALRLREARALPAVALRRLARAGASRAHARFRWEDSARRAVELLEELSRTRVPRSLRASRAAALADARRLDAAWALYAAFMGEGGRLSRGKRPARL
jgi:glycosyltransferase involved in cell wall biosynthesis